MITSTPNNQDGKSALLVAAELRNPDDEKMQLTLMHPLLKGGALVTKNVREALLRDDFWHRFVEKDASAAVVALIAARASDLADEKDKDGRSALDLMSTEVKKVGFT